LIKIGDKVFYAYNGRIKGIVREIKTTKAKYHLDAGSSSGSLVALVEVAGQKDLVPLNVSDLMRDD
jgi:hypothetical protein